MGRALTTSDYRSLSWWHEPRRTDWTPAAGAARRPRRRRRDRRRRLHRAVDGLLPGRGRPVAAGRGARGRGRRLRRLGTQRRLVLGAVPGLAGDSWPRCSARPRRRALAPARGDAGDRRRGRPGRRRPRASTPHCAKGGTVVLARTRAQLAPGPGRGRATPARWGRGEDDVRLLDAPRRPARCCAATGVRGATYTPDCAAVHPARLVRGLAEAVERRGVTIHEQHPASSDRAGPGRAPTRGTVRAEVVVRATEGYTAEPARAAARASCRSTR